MMNQRPTRIPALFATLPPLKSFFESLIAARSR